MSIKLILFSFLLSIGLNTKRLSAQKADSLNKLLKKESFIISSNGIYNYFTNKTLVNIINPDGRLPNSRQIVYYWQYKYYDTYTFDLSLQYNRFFSKKLSLSYGIRLDQLKSVRKTHLYIDSSAYLPNEKKLTDSRYSLSFPVLGNFYLKRFRFSFGLYTYFFTVSKSVYLDDYGVKSKSSKFGFGPQFLGQESVAFKLYKNKGIYLQLGAIHSFDFNDNYGYNNFFTFGLSFETSRL